MAEYCTIEEVKLNHERIPDNAETDGAIAQHITTRSAMVDGYIRGKVQLPFETIPTIINEITIDLATYRTLRGLYGAQSEEYQAWIAEYKTAIETLEAIRDCTITLDPDDATAYQRIKSNTRNKEAIFNLAHPYSQDYHPTDGDKRYGEN
jgi:phage gp36-like protein